MTILRDLQQGNGGTSPARGKSCIGAVTGGQIHSRIPQFQDQSLKHKMSKAGRDIPHILSLRE